ncbi:hypothetical protein GCM10010302_04320 [Streptomyces polychromogenes]|uniref:Transposase n=1 Tax=Streptomyces polychromogenes TaxID=67342 RepID=A0ABN0V0Y4_9ACTN
MRACTRAGRYARLDDARGFSRGVFFGRPAPLPPALQRKWASATLVSPRSPLVAQHDISTRTTKRLLPKARPGQRHRHTGHGRRRHDVGRHTFGVDRNSLAPAGIQLLLVDARHVTARRYQHQPNAKARTLAPVEDPFTQYRSRLSRRNCAATRSDATLRLGTVPTPPSLTAHGRPAGDG